MFLHLVGRKDLGSSTCNFFVFFFRGPIPSILCSFLDLWSEGFWASRCFPVLLSPLRSWTLGFSFWRLPHCNTRHESNGCLSPAAADPRRVLPLATPIFFLGRPLGLFAAGFCRSSGVLPISSGFNVSSKTTKSTKQKHNFNV